MKHLNKSSHKPKAKLPAPAARFTFEAIGTHWLIDIYEPLSGARSAELSTTIQNRIAAFDRIYSRFRSDSLVTTMARKPGVYTLPPDAKKLLDTYYHLYIITNGRLTPLIGQVLVDAGYDDRYSLRSQKPVTPPKWEDVIDYAFPRLTLKQPALLDFGAAGKGYVVDIVSELLSQQGIASFCINAGGDILFHTDTSHNLAIALEHPGDTSLAIGVTHIHNQSLCGSAGNRRAWEGYHHIINPESLTSPQHIHAVWVVAKDAIISDGLTTALFFMSPKTLQKHYDFEYAIVNQDYSLQYSPGFPATFYTN